MSLKARTHAPELREGLAAALQTVSRRCPGEIGRRLAESLNERFGEYTTDHQNRRYAT